MVLYILLGILPLLGILFLLLNRPEEKTGAVSQRQFHSQGLAEGFSFSERRRLRKLVEQSGNSDPLSLFQSPELMEYCIRSLARTLRVSMKTNPALQRLVERLYECRKKMQAEGVTQGMLSSREIEEGQNLRVISDSVIYRSQVVKSADQYMIISRPVNPESRSAPVWQGRKISVYFWKEEDAGYVFDCEVLDEVRVKGFASLKISHSNALFRTQKRRSLRVKTHKSTYLYLLNGETPQDDRLETEPGLKCFVEDISDTGCAVTIGGRAEKGLRVKLQLELGRKPIAMCGTVRFVEYDQETNLSLLHIEADPLNVEAKNAIFAEMFETMPSQ